MILNSYLLVTNFIESFKYITPKFVSLNTRDSRNINMTIHIAIENDIMLVVFFRKLQIYLINDILHENNLIKR